MTLASDCHGRAPGPINPSFPVCPRRTLKHSKSMKRKDLFVIRVRTLFASAISRSIFIFAVAAKVFTQSKPVSEPAEDYTWWYASLVVLVAALAGAIVWMVKSRRAGSDSKSAKPASNSGIGSDSWESGALDADRELEWYRQAKKSAKAKKKNLEKDLPKTSSVLKSRSERSSREKFSETEIRDKLKQLKFGQLPISKLKKLELARPFSPLPLSNDDALMSAIEQTQDEYEEDEAVRDLAVRILARFKTRNSVESLSQVALYDLSSNLRSKAVSILADFDHESVFETILLACADPTREVRAAAARGLFRLSFDRADAWTRICETKDEFRMRHSARAAMEADLVLRSLDRLVHPDHKIAYEAFTLLALMIKTDETEKLFEAVESHHDENVQLGFLKVIEIVQDDRCVPRLQNMLNKLMIPKDMKNRIEEVIASVELVGV